MDPYYKIVDLGRKGVFLDRVEGNDCWAIRISARHTHRPTAGAIRWARYLIEADRAGDLSIKALGKHVLLNDVFDDDLPFVPHPGGETDD